MTLTSSVGPEKNIANIDRNSKSDVQKPNYLYIGIIGTFIYSSTGWPNPLSQEITYVSVSSILTKETRIVKLASTYIFSLIRFCICICLLLVVKNFLSRESKLYFFNGISHSRQLVNFINVLLFNKTWQQEVSLCSMHIAEPLKIVFFLKTYFYGAFILVSKH